MVEKLILTEPIKELENLAMEYKNDYINRNESHINGSCGFMKYPDYDEWLDVVNRAHNAETSLYHVPATTYFTIRESDNKIIGSIQLRHDLDDQLRKSGGHIGYGICPSERRKGYATRQLSQVLLIAKALGIPKVMITCDKDNIASAKVAVKNGGVLSWEGYSEEDQTVIQNYWLDLSAVNRAADIINAR